MLQKPTIFEWQSRRAGVSLRYLLSEEFSSLAAVRSGKVNPTFDELGRAFWLCESPLGHDIPCPRDGRLGPWDVEVGLVYVERFAVPSSVMERKGFQTRARIAS